MALIVTWSTLSLTPLFFSFSGAVSLIILAGLTSFWAMICVAIVLQLRSSAG